MGRAPCCEKGVRKGAWTPEEDRILIAHIQSKGHANWRALPKLAGLKRCGKGCRLRWLNYLKPDIKRGNFSLEEENAIINLHSQIGNKWSAIAATLPGRTDNEIKNVWHAHLKKRAMEIQKAAAQEKPAAEAVPVPAVEFHGDVLPESQIPTTVSEQSANTEISSSVQNPQIPNTVSEQPANNEISSSVQDPQIPNTGSEQPANNEISSPVQNPQIPNTGSEQSANNEISSSVQNPPPSPIEPNDIPVEEQPANNEISSSVQNPQIPNTVSEQSDNNEISSSVQNPPAPLPIEPNNIPVEAAPVNASPVVVDNYTDWINEMIVDLDGPLPDQDLVAKPVVSVSGSFASSCSNSNANGDEIDDWLNYFLESENFTDFLAIDP